MRYIIQRVHEASVTINHEEIRTIGLGLLIYVGISQEDVSGWPQKIEKFVSKIKHLKLFEDGQGKINASLLDENGEILLVSNFTLHGRNHKGTQVDFSKAAWFVEAKNIYEHLVEMLIRQWVRLQTGEFGEYMDVSSIVDGPVNVVLDY